MGENGIVFNGEKLFASTVAVPVPENSVFEIEGRSFRYEKSSEDSAVKHSADTSGTLLLLFKKEL